MYIYGNISFLQLKTNRNINYFWDVLYLRIMVSIQPIMTVLRMPLLQCLFNPAPSF